MMTAARYFAATFIAATGALVLGCHTTEPRSPDATLAEVNPPKPPELGRGAPRHDTEVSYRVMLGEGVGGLCAGPSPYYDTARAKAKHESEATMQNLAACMLDGPLKGKSIILIGHTDPRGSDELNDKLGQKRANDVRRYLIDQGISPDRITAETAGKRTANDNPDRWQTDRRVEIQLDDTK